MISPDRLSTYKSFIDPDNTGTPYDSRKGLERIMGILSPDPKGIVVAAMGSDWYGKQGELKSKITMWLNELGLSYTTWPISRYAAWSYLTAVNKRGKELMGRL